MGEGDIRSDRCSAIRKLVSDFGHQCSEGIAGVRFFKYSQAQFLKQNLVCLMLSHKIEIFSDKMF